MDNKINIECTTSGFEEATEQIETLAEAYDGFPAQVVIKGCRDCKINVYPSQTKFVNAREEDNEEH